MDVVTGRAAGAGRRRAGDSRQGRWLLVACLVGIFSTTFPATILTISLRPIAEDLDSLPSTIAWVTTAPMLASAVATPLLGRLGDLRGHRRLYLLGLVLAGVFSVFTAVAWNAPSLIAFRTLSQLGAAATVPATFAILFRAFPAAERVRASSLASGTLAGAAVVGVVIGGPLVDLVGWRPIFLVHAAISFLALVFGALTLPRGDRGQSGGELDVPGAVALAVATLLLTFGVNRLGAWGWSPIPLVCLGLVPCAVWALVIIERRARSPLLPLGVLAARNTRVVCAATFLLGAGWMGNFVITPLLLLSVLGVSVALTSLITVPRAASIMLSAPVAGRLGVRFGERRLVVVASAGLALVLGLMAVGAATSSVLVIAVALPLSGWALGHAQPGLISAMGHAVGEEDLGVAVSLQQTANQIGAVVGIGLFTALAADATTPGPFVLVFVLTAGCAVAAALLALRIQDGRAVERHLPAPVDDGTDPVPTGLLSTDPLPTGPHPADPLQTDPHPTGQRHP